MAKTITTTAVKRILTKGLTGWQAGKLVLQDMIDAFFYRDSVLSEADMAALQQAPMEGTDVRDYNMFIALSGGFYRGRAIAELACKDACLQIELLDSVLQDAARRRTVELFESFGPRVVTRKQYEEIVADQREGKLAVEYDLGYVIEQRFYAISPPEAKTAVEESGGDFESIADFVAAVPEEYADLCKQAIDEIQKLLESGRLAVIFHEEDTKLVEPLLKQWMKNRLSQEDIIGFVDLLHVAGQTIYDCEGLPEWKALMNQYQRHWLDDERFRHAYAIVDDCPAVWLDTMGYYKGPPRPSDWITHSTEVLLGLIDPGGTVGKSIGQVGAVLTERLETIEQNIRVFLAVKAILDMAADAVDMDVPGDAGIFAGQNMRLDAVVALYNRRLEGLKEKRNLWESGETRLEKVLRMLPAIDVNRLKPSPDSLKQLRGKILSDARGEEWLRRKLESLACGDGVNCKDLFAG